MVCGDRWWRRETARSTAGRTSARGALGASSCAAEAATSPMMQSQSARLRCRVPTTAGWRAPSSRLGAAE
eukprot:9301843-Prorocentrum_lima.AAC.1